MKLANFTLQASPSFNKIYLTYFFRLKSEISQLGLFKNIVSKAKQANSHHHHQQANGYHGGETQHSFYSQHQPRKYQQHQEEGEGEEDGEGEDYEGEGDMVLVSPDMCSVSIDD